MIEMNDKAFMTLMTAGLTYYTNLREELRSDPEYADRIAVGARITKKGRVKKLVILKMPSDFKRHTRLVSLWLNDEQCNAVMLVGPEETEIIKSDNPDLTSVEVRRLINNKEVEVAGSMVFIVCLLRVSESDMPDVLCSVPEGAAEVGQVVRGQNVVGYIEELDDYLPMSPMTEQLLKQRGLR